MRRALIFILGMLGLVSQVHGADFPFTDVKPSDPYYTAVRDLYEGGVISNNGDNLFRPDEPMNRDFYVSLTVGVGCKKCNTPSQEDIIRYQYSPFIDLPKINPYYYCVAYAKDVGITQGYTVDTTGKATCENGSSYMSSPFCPSNTISRIEAVAVLLRRANLWNDTLNAGSFDKTLSIPDTSIYWYGYAKKGIEAGILSQKSDGTIGQDEKITRGEFAMMAARILRYTQCELSSNPENTVEGAIGIENKKGDPLPTSTFEQGDDFVLVPIVTSGDWDFNWHATNPITGEVIISTGDTLPGSLFGDGTWIVLLDIIDPTTGDIVSQPDMTLQVGNSSGIYNGGIIITDDNNTVRNDNSFTLDDHIVFSSSGSGDGVSSWSAVNEVTGQVVTGNGDTFDGGLLGVGEWTVTLTTKDKDTGVTIDTDTRIVFITDGDSRTNDEGDLSVLIGANPLVSHIGGSVDFTAIVSGGSSSNSYSWDFGDGNTSSTVGNTSHTYTTPGIYKVTLTVTDKVTGVTRQSSVIIRITGESDSDGDGLFDTNDACPLVHGLPTNSGCPLIGTTDYTELVEDILTGESSFVDTDGDGISNIDDACPWVSGSIANHGCPPGTSTDTDGDGTPNDTDKCPTIAGSTSNSGCPEISITDDIKKNACIDAKLQEDGLIFGSVACSTCPCNRRLDILAVLRACDIVFPTILSPDGENVYARGGFYTIE